MKRYFRHKINNLLVVNGIVTVHYFEFGKKFVGPTESHDFWEIVYAEKNDLVCFANGERIALKPGEMLFHKPGELHSLSANGLTPPNVFVISFVCKSEAMRFFENKIISLSSAELKFVYSIIEEAKRSFNIPFSNPYTTKMELSKSPILGGVQMIKNYLEMLLISLMRSQTETESGNSIFLSENELGNQLVKKTIRLLNDKVYDTCTIDEICKTTVYSRAYLFKKFKESTGKSVMEYFIELKIQKAKQLIRLGEMSVREISEKLAFDTPNYFSKTFKKKTGLTPLEYKKRTSLS